MVDAHALRQLRQLGRHRLNITLDGDHALDENFPLRLHRRLQAEGIDSEHLITVGQRGIPDAQVVEHLAEGHVVLLTQDREFEYRPELASRSHLPVTLNDSRSSRYARASGPGAREGGTPPAQTGPSTGIRLVGSVARGSPERGGVVHVRGVDAAMVGRPVGQSPAQQDEVRRQPLVR